MSDQDKNWRTTRIELATSEDGTYTNKEGIVVSAFQMNQLLIRLTIAQWNRHNHETRTVIRLYVHDRSKPLPTILIEDADVVLDGLEAIYSLPIGERLDTQE